MSYIPLEYVKNMEGTYESFVKSMNQCANKDYFADMTDEEFVDYVLSRDFATEKGNKELDNFLFDTFVPIINYSDHGKGQRLLSNPDAQYHYYRTEVKDYIAHDPVVRLWEKNKQVYKLDKYFGEALLNTDKLSVSKEQILRLPTNVFYIDLSDMQTVSPVHGMYVYVKCIENTCVLASYTILNQNSSTIFYSYYSHALFDENNMLNFDKKDLEALKSNYDFREGASETNRFLNFDFSKTYSRDELIAIVYQLICYITSKEPEIEEGITKSTYKPYVKPRNTFSEVRQYEVGIRFGKKINTQIREMKRKKNNDDNLSSNIAENKEKNKRKSPRPHFVCAHWHHYWTGEGRKNYEVRWIEARFDGFSGDVTNTDVVIHKVR